MCFHIISSRLYLLLYQHGEWRGRLARPSGSSCSLWSLDRLRSEGRINSPVARTRVESHLCCIIHSAIPRQRQPLLRGMLLLAPSPSTPNRVPEPSPLVNAAMLGCALAALLVSARSHPLALPLNTATSLSAPPPVAQPGGLCREQTQTGCHNTILPYDTVRYPYQLPNFLTLPRPQLFLPNF